MYSMYVYDMKLHHSTYLFEISMYRPTLLIGPPYDMYHNVHINARWPAVTPYRYGVMYP